MAHLIAQNGPDAGQRYDLNGARCVMGRHPDCDVVVEVGAVSRYHAEIVKAQSGFELSDLKSRNGTFLNNLMVAEAKRLKTGDVIRVCDVAFTYHDPKVLEGEPNVDGSAWSAVLVDDEDTTRTSTIMSKLNVSMGSGGVELTAPPEVKLAALVEITQNLGKALSLDEVLSKLLNSLFKIFYQADRGLIVLRENGKLIPRWTKFRRDDNEGTIRISRTIVNQVIDSKEAILSADAATDERFEMSQSIADFRIRSMMCAPLINGDGEAIGVLQIDAVDSRNRYEEEDLELLVSIASQAAIAIDNARMHEQALEQNSLQRDLELAREVQNSFLPATAPDIKGYEFFHYYKPANHVGGDYYDYIHLQDGRIAIVVADVVGHGVAAALLMAKLSAETRFCLASTSTPAKAVTQLNNRITALNVERFITMVLVVIDPKNNEVTIVNAGHMAPIMRKQSGDLVEPSEDSGGLPIGIADGIDYEQIVVKLEPSELMLLYTDGINESENEAEE
ncbi:MAG: sigma-B regulation protein RsbU (phosphoserine phosphatase), partial [Pirellulaceae bacterium]